MRSGLHGRGGTPPPPCNYPTCPHPHAKRAAVKEVAHDDDADVIIAAASRLPAYTTPANTHNLALIHVNPNGSRRMWPLNSASTTGEASGRRALPPSADSLWAPPHRSRARTTDAHVVWSGRRAPRAPVERRPKLVGVPRQQLQQRAAGALALAQGRGWAEDV